jgi:hypothetical protein
MTEELFKEEDIVKVNYLIVYNAMLENGKNVLKNNYIAGKRIETPDDVVNIINTLQESEKVFDVKIINIIKIE